jgi:hypothetical protein
MGQLKFISREKLVEYLDEEMRQFFNERGLYELNQYGWLSDGELDPEYLGHAMWQENPPELKKLVGLGDEFTNLMRSARHSLGFACLYHDATDSLVNDSGYSFSYHFADTTNKLHLASDRIREFFIAAFAQLFHNSESWPLVGKVIQDERGNDHFRAPFQQIRDEVATWKAVGLPLQDCLTTLLPLVEEVARNRSVNQDPFRHQKLFHNRIAAAVTNLALGYPDEALSDDLSRAGDSSSRELVGWYDALVRVSSHVFMVEHLLRGLSRQSGAVPSRPRKHKTS